MYDPYPLYHYNLTEESTIRGEFNPRRFAEADVALEKAEDYRIRYPELYSLAMARYIAICLNIIHISHGVASCSQRRKEMIKQMRGALPQSAVDNLRKQEKIKLTVLRISPAAYEILMRLYDQLT